MRAACEFARQIMSNDVVILGGGLAGATLAIQLAQRMPELSIEVIERQRFPVPAAAYKVGESSVEIGSHYYNEVLGLSHALIPAKLPKLGLRYFFPKDGNHAIEARPELGQTHYHSVGSTQFDRGVQENILREQCLARGIRFLDAAKVVEASVVPGGPHEVVYERDGQRHATQGRWLVDASGRASLLKRRLGLAESNGHHVNASWWRIEEPLAIDELSRDREWTRRVPFGMRRMSTNHFVGRGYWLWYIPLATNSISIGIVADPAYHPLDRINTFERCVEWMREYEPQALALMEPHVDKLQDFRTLKHFSHGCKQVYSGQRWALTGEAGVFLDPFYSPGSDFIGISNGFITSLIQHDMRGADHRGADLDAVARTYDRQYLALYRSFLLLYENQYGMFGNPQVMSLKIVWDYTGYWGSTALLYFQSKLTDLEFMRSVTIDVVQVHRLNHAAQQLFHRWNELDDGAWGESRLLNYHELEYLAEWQAALRRRYTDDELRCALRENRRIMEVVVAWLWRRATGSDRQIDPYRVSLQPEDVVRPSRRLDMFEALDAYIKSRTIVRDGIRTLVDVRELERASE